MLPCQVQKATSHARACTHTHTHTRAHTATHLKSATAETPTHKSNVKTRAVIKIYYFTVDVQGRAFWEIINGGLPNQCVS